MASTMSVKPVRGAAFGASRPPRRATVAVRSAYHACHNGAHLSKERKAELERVCEHIAQRGKGITACDEGPGTIGDRFAKCVLFRQLNVCISTTLLWHH